MVVMDATPELVNFLICERGMTLRTQRGYTLNPGGTAGVTMAPHYVSSLAGVTGHRGHGLEERMPRVSGHTRRPHQRQLMRQALTKGVSLPPKQTETSEPRTLPSILSITSKKTQ